MKKLNKKGLIILSVTAVVIIGIGLFLLLRPDGGSYQEETAKTQDIVTYYSYEGNIEAKEAQNVYANSVTSIKKLYVEEGDHVSKGDLLYEIDDNNIASKLTQAQASAQSAEISYQDSKKSLSRTKELYDQGAVSLQEYEKAVSNFEICQSQWIQAKANYDSVLQEEHDTRILAEIDGVVSEIYAEENDTVISGTKIMDVVNYDQLQVKIKVDEFDLDSVSEGRDAVVMVTALNKEVRGAVAKVSNQAEVNNGVSYFNAEIDLEQSTDLKVGLSVEVRIISQKADSVVAVPLKAISFDSENQPYILSRDADQKVTAKKVTVGINDGTVAEIKEGVSPGETVLIQNKSDESDSGITVPPRMRAN
ncbi:efflux RND transporter periplasmic adaptor subunit [Sinanaerobacter chloroacetimidivorans]|jgi:RND family efflux transporter MFP subunit|uniref:Efflux RND transporter periplasmic adaptor subunit n=1 Tax=Sinanaerobacter chloroacetimidivorans TaxID=2818044 RepID=A0A8J7W271_9FIRM|nr:efflux RND transporter periplasmic adaptor subunit [Sinanaerobacter chloroacetimidivorans]MBR0597751.1 efflux RND transporter periplasmic adaptor subunit [Sinanaerobacter chloroacetimidivorans]